MRCEGRWVAGVRLLAWRCPCEAQRAGDGKLGALHGGCVVGSEGGCGNGNEEEAVFRVGGRVGRSADVGGVQEDVGGGKRRVESKVRGERGVRGKGEVVRRWVSGRGGAGEKRQVGVESVRGPIITLVTELDRGGKGWVGGSREGGRGAAREKGVRVRRGGGGASSGAVDGRRRRVRSGTWQEERRVGKGRRRRREGGGKRPKGKDGRGGGRGRVGQGRGGGGGGRGRGRQKSATPSSCSFTKRGYERKWREDDCCVG